LDELGRAEAARERARRVLVLGIAPVEAGLEAEPATEEHAVAVAHAPARRVARVLVEPLFVGGAEALVEMDVKLKGTEGGRKRRRSRSAGAKKARALSTRIEDRRRRQGACARVSWPHICREDREYARQRHADV
jgi:hypothetical protein